MSEMKAIPDESKIREKKVNIPNELRSAYSDTALITAKQDTVTITFLETEALDPNQQKAVAIVILTPIGAKKLAESMTDMFNKLDLK